MRRNLERAAVILRRRGKGQLKCDGTRPETSRKGRVHLTFYRRNVSELYKDSGRTAL